MRKSPLDWSISHFTVSVGTSSTNAFFELVRNPAAQSIADQAGTRLRRALDQV